MLARAAGSMLMARKFGYSTPKSSSRIGNGANSAARICGGADGHGPVACHCPGQHHAAQRPHDCRHGHVQDVYGHRNRQARQLDEGRGQAMPGRRIEVGCRIAAGHLGHPSEEALPVSRTYRTPFRWNTLSKVWEKLSGEPKARASSTRISAAPAKNAAATQAPLLVRRAGGREAAVRCQGMKAWRRLLPVRRIPGSRIPTITAESRMPPARTAAAVHGMEANGRSTARTAAMEIVTGPARAAADSPRRPRAGRHQTAGQQEEKHRLQHVWQRLEPVQRFSQGVVRAPASSGPPQAGASGQAGTSDGLVQQSQQIGSVAALDQGFRTLAKFVVGQEAQPPGNFFRSADFQTLTVFHRADEV